YLGRKAGLVNIRTRFKELRMSFIYDYKATVIWHVCSKYCNPFRFFDLLTYHRHLNQIYKAIHIYVITPGICKPNAIYFVDRRPLGPFNSGSRCNVNTYERQCGPRLRGKPPTRRRNVALATPT